MIAIAILLAAQAVPQNMLNAADDADSAYVGCLFATSRAANGAGLSLEAFERKLASACHEEEEASVRAGAAVLRARGEANAVSTERQMAEDARRSVLDTYRHAIALQPELKKLAELCREHPDQCR